MLSFDYLGQLSRHVADTRRLHGAMSAFLEKLCPGENARVSINSDKGRGPIDRWGGQMWFFAWDLGELSHVAQNPTDTDDASVHVLIVYDHEPTLKWRREPSKGWVTRSLPEGME